jgi:hypothetical protein
MMLYLMHIPIGHGLVMSVDAIVILSWAGLVVAWRIKPKMV